MLNIRKLRLNNLYNIQKMNSSTAFGGFSERIYQKVSITRLPHESYTLYIDINDNVQGLFKHLNKLFPESNFITTNKFQNKLGSAVSEQDKKLSEQIKSLQLIQLLMHSNLLVYEEKNSVFNLCLGVEVKQYHETNNRNLPEHIASNIIQLSELWRTDRSVEHGLSKNQAYDQQQHKQYLQQKQQLVIEAKQSYLSYLDLYKFYNKQFIDSGKTRSLVANLVALMSVNWIFLFGVTYGGYGWDVGEPLSYLTNLAVDLIAMLGIFNMDQVIEKTGKQDFQNIALRMNLQSLLRTREFLITYTKRKL